MSEYQTIVSKVIEAYRRGCLVVIKNSAEHRIFHGAAITETDAAAIFHRQTREQKLVSSFSTVVIETTLSAQEWIESALPEFCSAAEALAVAGQFPQATEWETAKAKFKRELRFL